MRVGKDIHWRAERLFKSWSWKTKIYACNNTCLHYYIIHKNKFKLITAVPNCSIFSNDTSPASFLPTSPCLPIEVSTSPISASQKFLGHTSLFAFQLTSFLPIFPVSQLMSAMVKSPCFLIYASFPPHFQCSHTPYSYLSLSSFSFNSSKPESRSV